MKIKHLLPVLLFNLTAWTSLPGQWLELGSGVGAMV